MARSNFDAVLFYKQQLLAGSAQIPQVVPTSSSAGPEVLPSVSLRALVGVKSLRRNILRVGLCFALLSNVRQFFPLSGRKYD